LGIPTWGGKNLTKSIRRDGAANRDRKRSRIGKK